MNSWRSECVPEREQFESWREACCQHVYAITPEREQRGGFRGALQARRLAGLDVVELQCEGHRVLRRRATSTSASGACRAARWTATSRTRAGCR